MPAYVVVQIAVDDPVTYERYKELAPPSIAAYAAVTWSRGGRARCWKAHGAQLDSWCSSSEHGAGAGLVEFAGVCPREGIAAGLCTDGDAPSRGERVGTRLSGREDR